MPNPLGLGPDLSGLTTPSASGGGGGPLNYMARLGLGSGRVWGAPNPNSQALPAQASNQNLASAPDLTSLTQLVNSLNLNAQQQANQARIPGAAGLESQSSQNIGSELQGQLPQDVVNQLAQAAAERGISTGNNNFVQSLGLNTLGLQQRGQANLSAAYGRNPAAPIFDPTSQFLTPAQLGSLQTAGNRLALDWWEAMNPQFRGTGQRSAPSQPANTDWFSNALNSITGGQQPLGGGYTGAGTLTPYSGGYADDFFPGLDTPGSTDFSGNFNDPSSWIDSSGFDPSIYG